MSHLDGFFVGDGLHAINHGEVEIVRHKSRTDSLDFMRTGFHFLMFQRLGDDRTGCRLNRDRQERMFLFVLM